LIEFVSNLVSF